MYYKDSKLQRIWAICLRFYYLYKGSWTRLTEMLYWPFIQMLIWGFLTQHLATNSSWIAQAFGVLLAGALLWDVLMRAQISYAISFLEELWSKNIGHLFVSPLKFSEWIAALSLLSLIKTLIGVIPAMIAAIYLYHYSIFEMGLPFILLFASLLLTGIWLSLMVQAVIMRCGLGAEAFAWTIAFALSPLSCVFYPLTTLPEWLQPIALALPTTYCFEGMRDILMNNHVNWSYIGVSYALNVAYFFLAAILLNYMFKKIREDGNLLQMGE